MAVTGSPHSKAKHWYCWRILWTTCGGLDRRPVPDSSISSVAYCRRSERPRAPLSTRGDTSRADDDHRAEADVAQLGSFKPLPEKENFLRSKAGEVNEQQLAKNLQLGLANHPNNLGSHRFRHTDE